MVPPKSHIRIHQLRSVSPKEDFECNMNLWVSGIPVGWSLRTQLVLNMTSTMGWGREAQQHIHLREFMCKYV